MDGGAVANEGEASNKRLMSEEVREGSWWYCG